MSKNWKETSKNWKTKMLCGAALCAASIVGPRGSADADQILGGDILERLPELMKDDRLRDLSFHPRPDMHDMHGGWKRARRAGYPAGIAPLEAKIYQAADNIDRLKPFLDQSARHLVLSMTGQMTGEFARDFARDPVFPERISD
jgi:hypothetical protein